MNAKEAIETAKEYVQDLFRDEGIAQVGLEELDFCNVPPAWDVTIGFTRRLPNPQNPITALLDTSGQRVYKIVRISEDGEIMSLKHRHFAASD